MFKPFLWNEQDLGWAATDDDVFVFFGNRHFNQTHFSQVFPQFQFFLLKQTHSDKVVPATTATIEADAHFTDQPNQALVVQSADCLPILMANKKQIVACHAGWRGMAANIVGKVAQQVPHILRAYIGPHIGPQSFEVDTDVAAQILKASPSPIAFVHLMLPHENPAKRYVHLAALAQLQLRAAFGEIAVEQLPIDTKTNPSFHSYRRDRDKAGRQFSFIARLR